ncbi:MAG: Tm-1-like ATP-binding domain-containing protein [Actinomycetota bacterium]|nr:Tm-1-like ATP-binding domain-containing protein [Actinomycetota bacterium]
MTVVVLVGTLDTKGLEYGFLRDRLRENGVETLLVVAGILGDPRVEPDVTREEVARAAGTDIEGLARAGDRGVAVAAMARGAGEVVKRLHAEGRLDGVVGLGGSGGSSLVTRAMRELPVGVPKLMVSTVASGDTRPYVGESDVTMMYSVVDMAGINRISARILSNAAGAIAGMAKAEVPEVGERPLVGATMFGVTTPCVDAARGRLEALGYEVLVFHATGAGGRSMEALVRDGFITAVLDTTTTELADDLVGGVLSAGPDRMEAAGELGIPQVVSLGALDMVNFGPPDTIPKEFEGRLFYEHNPTVTLMRTTAEECAELGRRIANKLNAASGPLTLFIPLGGVSLIDTEGQIFHDPEADAALFGALRENLDENMEVMEIDTDVNDPAFARAMADRLHEHYGAWSREGTNAGVTR